MAIGFSMFVSSQKKALRNPFVLLKNQPSLSIVAPCHRRHPDFGPRLRAFLFKSLANDRSFVFVFDLPATISKRHIGLYFAGLKLVFAAEDFERQVTRRFSAGVEVLVKPPLWRNDDGSRLPIDPSHFLPLGPEQRITFARENKHMRAGAVAMRLFIDAHRKPRNMRAHHAFGHFKKNGGIALASL